MFKLVKSAGQNVLWVAGSKLTVIVTNLRVNSSYEFKIAGKTKAGLGPYSETITIKVIQPKYLPKGKLLPDESKKCFTKEITTSLLKIYST